MQLTVLGAGLVGSAIVKDLAREPDLNITAVDIDPRALARLSGLPSVHTILADVQEPGCLPRLLEDSDLVVSAVPGFMGYNTLEGVIEAGKDVVDISFFGEDPFPLDALACEKGVTAAMDCGVAPGLCNVLLGHVAQRLERTDRYVCYVGGLPQVRQWPYEYKAVFSPLDVLEEYTRPVRFVEYGREVVRPALSDVELLDFPEVGTLEAFNTDGLRTLTRTMDIPFMREKTLRYPGHANLMRIFRESGFFNTTPVQVNGCAVQPIALSSKLIFEQWRLGEGEQDLTVMKIIIEGQSGSSRQRFTYCLLDRFDHLTQTTSMARTTGYTCAIVARQILSGLLDVKGLVPPEMIGQQPGCTENLLAELARRGIHLQELVETG